MADYLFLPKIHSSIDAECDMTCIVSNRRRKSDLLARHKVALYRQSKGSTTWKLLETVVFHSSIRRTISSLDYNMAVGELIVGVPMSIEADVPSEITALPKPYSRRNDAAPIEERVAIRFVYKGARSSYQGDYPYSMAKRTDGSLISLGSLVMDQPAKARTFAVIVNVCGITLTAKDPFRFTMHDAATQETLAAADYEHNSVCAIEIPQDLNDGQREVFFSSRSITGIPIFVTISDGAAGASISVEHTHPPHEYFWQHDRMAGGALVKKTWLAKVPVDA